VMDDNESPDMGGWIKGCLFFGGIYFLIGIDSLYHGYWYSFLFFITSTLMFFAGYIMNNIDGDESDNQESE